MKILTTKNINDEEWLSKVDRVVYEKKFIKFPIGKVESLLNDVIRALVLFRRREKYDVVITYFSNTAIIFALLQQIFGKKVKHLTAEAHINKKKNRILNWMKTFLLRQAMKSIDMNIVHSSGELENYVKEFRLPRKKFKFVRFHHSLEGYEEFDIKDEGYLFTGGDNGRDYKNFLKAVDGLPIKVVIASFNLPKQKKMKIPSNVEAITTNNKGFRKLMAEASIVAMPLDLRRLDAIGHQTYLNAMAMGKPLVITDALGVRDHINNNVAIIVKDNGERMREGILKLIKNKKKAKEIGSKAKKFVGKYTLKAYSQQVLKEAYNL